MRREHSTNVPPARQHPDLRQSSEEGANNSIDVPIKMSVATAILSTMIIIVCLPYSQTLFLEEGAMDMLTVLLFRQETRGGRIDLGEGAANHYTCWPCDGITANQKTTLHRRNLSSWPIRADFV